LNRARLCEVVWFRLNQAVAQSLVVAFAVVMGCEVLNGSPQRTFPEQNQPFEAGLLYAAHKSLGVRVGETRALQTVVMVAHKFLLSRTLSIP
jgi:hypothetical protein